MENKELSIRPIRPSDASKISDALAYTSEETLYRRFHSSKKTLSARELRFLTEIDGHDHFALVAECAASGRLAGVGRIVRHREDNSRAEFAVIVADPYQGQGIGGQLLQLLVSAARERDVSFLHANIQGENRGMLALWRSILPHSKQLVGGANAEHVAAL